MKKIVLFIHQGAELYGSDKVLLNLAAGLRDSPFQALVLLPFDGPLVAELAREGVETHIVPVTKVSRALFSVRGLLGLPGDLWRATRAITRVMAGRKVAVVHSNTLAVLSGAVWAALHRVPHLWHVHEILMKPALIRRGFPLLVRLLADKAVSNSSLTTRWLVDEQASLARRTVTIWNGISRTIPHDAARTAQLKAEVNGGVPERLIAALVGRINHWKGHLLLVEAAGLLWQRGYRDIRYLVVGSIFAQQEHFLDQLKEAIAASQARDCFVLRGFTESIWDVWDACDIALVPSTEPEPFGMVAIEAMCAGKPLVAAAHGGLLDIVDDGVSGLLATPCDPRALADAIARLADDAALRRQMGAAGQQRQTSLFSLESQVAKTVEVYQEMLAAAK
jgi:glycosyltransferase involved in cell wall biosynthesis